jgi:hypothetical protein
LTRTARESIAFRSGAGDGGADWERERSSSLLFAASSRSSSGSDAAPLSFLTMHPTRPRGEVSDSEAASPAEDVAARGVRTGPTASISRQRWMREDARGPDGGRSGPGAAAQAVEEASEGAGEGSRKPAARAATGRVAEASSESSASLARRGGGEAEAVAAAAAAAQRSRMIRRRLGVGSTGAEEAVWASSEVEKGWRWCGGMRTLKKGRGLEEGSLHGAESRGMAATEEAMEGGKKGKSAARRG